jgi:hypothetical protein
MAVHTFFACVLVLACKAGVWASPTLKLTFFSSLWLDLEVASDTVITFTVLQDVDRRFIPG